MQRFARAATRVLSTVSRHNTTAPRVARFISTIPTPANPLPKAAMAPNANTLIELLKGRRSIYALNKDLAITPARIQEIVSEALQHVPSSFNSQSNRVVVLFGAEHDKFWDITTETLKAILPEDKFEATAGRMAMFKGAAGSVRPPITCFPHR
jgi:hypothetical protein